MTEPTSLVEAAREVLLCGDADEKARTARRVAAAWSKGLLSVAPGINMPVRPNRPARPELRLPRDMPRRSFKGERGRVALLHSLAHIELNAIDLAFDLVGRFAGEPMPRAFLDDWIRVGDDEARHFMMLQARPRMARPMATTRPMTVSGRLRKKHGTTFSPGSRSCRWCWKRGGLMSPPA
jgi:uncharacterized ferritin-like protein (DUF455 family)